MAAPAEARNVAPNLEAFAGIEVATRLIDLAGGSVAKLAALPADELKKLGHAELVQASPEWSRLYAGVVSRCDPLQQHFGEVIDESRKKAAQWASSSCKRLAAIDAARGAPSGEAGREEHAKVLRKLAELEEPTYRTAEERLLHAPQALHELRQKRGGAKAQRMNKEAEPTALEKLNNRRQFGVDADLQAQQNLQAREVLAEQARMRDKLMAATSALVKPEDPFACYDDLLQLVIA